MCSGVIDMDGLLYRQYRAPGGPVRSITPSHRQNRSQRQSQPGVATRRMGEWRGSSSRRGLSLKRAERDTGSGLGAAASLDFAPTGLTVSLDLEGA